MEKQQGSRAHDVRSRGVRAGLGMRSWISGECSSDEEKGCDWGSQELHCNAAALKKGTF